MLSAISSFYTTQRKLIDEDESVRIHLLRTERRTNIAIANNTPKKDTNDSHESNNNKNQI